MIKNTKKRSKQSKLLAKIHKNKRTKDTSRNYQYSEADYINRELGWLEFNQRVLYEAEDNRNPILERVKFLSICGSNLDEFFMKRVGGLKRQLAFSSNVKSSDNKTPSQQLKDIRKFVLKMHEQQQSCFEKKILPELKNKKINLKKIKDCNEEEKKFLKSFFYKNVFPVLTPLSVDPGHPFPFISNLSLSLGVTLKQPGADEKLFARIKIPQVLPSWVLLPHRTDAEEIQYIHVVDLITMFIDSLFPSMIVINVMPFRLVRNADIMRDEEDVEDLLEMIEEELRQRRFAEVVKLEHGPKPDPWMLDFLVNELELNDEDVYEISGPIDLPSIITFYDLPKEDLKYPIWKPVTPILLQSDERAKIFEEIKKSDILLHHPYESFSSTVEKFIRTAAVDSRVIAIKMTLYRAGDNSPMIKSLIRAAEEGKQVVCLVELKARFDEERNIYWAQALENAGVHVVYGIVGFKTHAKTALVVRQEHTGLKSYVHIGTGNYNAATSRFYTDVGLLTCNELIVNEVVEFFNYLTGRSLKSDYEHLLIAPVNMKKKFIELIKNEKENKKLGKPAQIIAKMNNLEESDITQKLYAASQVGVEITLLVRGFCCLRPQMPNKSEKIKVISAIGRFLEHSRIFYFQNGQVDPIDGLFFIGSADWMHRNLHSRIECIVPIFDLQAKQKLWKILQLHKDDTQQSWDMLPDGSYKKRNLVSGGFSVQEVLMQMAKDGQS